MYLYTCHFEIVLRQRGISYMKYCKNCGKLLEKTDKKCSVCGGKVKKAEHYFDNVLLCLVLSVLFPVFGVLVLAIEKRVSQKKRFAIFFGTLSGILAYAFLAILSSVI